MTLEVPERASIFFWAESYLPKRRRWSPRVGVNLTAPISLYLFVSVP